MPPSKPAKKRSAYGEGGPPVATDVTTDRRPLGVPSDFETQYQNPSHAPGFMGPPSPGAVVSGGARYFTGDEWEIAGKLSPEIRGQLQLMMKSLGLIPKKTVLSFGNWDGPSASAFREVLSFANASTRTWEETLVGMRDTLTAAGGLGAGGGGTTRELPPVRLSNPDDIRRVIREGARRVLGSGNVDEEDVNRLISGYQAKEREYQQKSQVSGATVIDPPDLEGFVEDELKDSDPIRADSQKVIDGLTAVFDMFGGGSGG